MEGLNAVQSGPEGTNQMMIPVEMAFVSKGLVSEEKHILHWGTTQTKSQMGLGVRHLNLVGQGENVARARNSSK